MAAIIVATYKEQVRSFRYKLLRTRHFWLKPTLQEVTTMNEYVREPGDFIKAGFARNARKLLEQYRSLTEGFPETERYDITLLLSVLQSLLTLANEYLMVKQNREENWERIAHDVPKWQGLSRSFVKDYTFPEDITYLRFIESLRNAMSHPAPQLRKPFLPTTGYTTVPDGSGVIARISFTDSPWVVRGCYKVGLPKQKRDDMIKELINRNPTSLVRKADIQTGDKLVYKIEVDGDLFIPLFRAEMKVSDLYIVATELATHLEHPIVSDAMSYGRSRRQQAAAR